MTPFRRDLAVSALSSSTAFAHFAPASLSSPGGALGMTSSGSLTDRVGYRIKRVIDRGFAFLALLALLPLMMAIAVAIRLGSRGPVLLSLPRVGFRERIFRCYTFRTTSGDGQITRAGRFLHRTGLDELPLLLNVLKGEMSLVGPLAHAPNGRAAGRCYSELVPFYDRRHTVYPGLTGWAQVNGWRGDIHFVGDIETRVRYDLEYIYGWSLLFDLRVIARAVIQVFNDRMPV